MKKHYSMHILLIVIIGSIFPSGEQEEYYATINDHYEFGHVEDISDIPIFFTTGTVDEGKIHKLTLRVASPYPSGTIIEAIDSITVDSDLFSNQLIIPQVSLASYFFDSNDSNPNEGVVVSIESVEKNILDLHIIKKPDSVANGVFESNGDITILLNNNASFVPYELTLIGYNSNLQPINKIADNDTVLRFNIPPKIQIQVSDVDKRVVSGLAENTFYQNQEIRLNYDLEKTFSSNMHVTWDFDGITPTPTETQARDLYLNMLGSFDIRVTGEDDLGNKTSDNLQILVIENQAPTAPEILYPKENEVFDAQQEMFCWNVSLDPEENVITYEVQISENSSFDSLVNENSERFVSIYSIISLSSILLFSTRKRRHFIAISMLFFYLLYGCALDQEESFEYPTDSKTYSFKNLESNSEYYWRIIAEDEWGNSTTSEVIRIETK